jgi:hypothetical protein
MGILSATDKKSRIRIRIRIRKSADPDPYKNVMDPQHYNKNYVIRRSDCKQQQKNRFPPSDSSSSKGDWWLSTRVKRGWLLSPTRIDERYSMYGTVVAKTVLFLGSNQL